MGEQWNHLEGKVVMITGASSGIGRDLAVNLAAAGCRVIAAARRIERLISLCDELNAMKAEPSDSVRSIAVELNVSSKGEEIEKAVGRAWNAFGRIDVLVNNAGIRGNVHSPLDWPEEEWHENISTNLTGLWLVSKYVCRLMKHSKQSGSVINISSIGGIMRGQLPGGSAYSASKAAVNALTKVMALELGEYNIRVNAIAPGIFKSEITKGLLQKNWLNKVAMRTVPLRTYGTLDPALTSLVRYLIHDSSQYISGNIFIVDAGVTLPGVPIFSSL